MSFSKLPVKLVQILCWNIRSIFFLNQIKHSLNSLMPSEKLGVNQFGSGWRLEVAET